MKKCGSSSLGRRHIIGLKSQTVIVVKLEITTGPIVDESTLVEVEWVGARAMMPATTSLTSEWRQLLRRPYEFSTAQSYLQSN